MQVLKDAQIAITVCACNNGKLYCDMLNQLYCDMLNQ